MSEVIKIEDYDKIMSDHNLFNQVVYTPLSEALRLLDERRKDPILMAKIEKLLNGNIPEIFKQKKCGVLSRHIATPNSESRRFISIAKENNLYPVFFEYHNDKFTSNNEFKHSLGQLRIQKKDSKDGNPNIEKITIIDFNLHNGKKLKNIETIWSEPIVDFHRKLFSIHDYKKNDFELYDGSDWFQKNGGRAIEYYKNLLLMFTCYGILFENFLISKDYEGDFTKNIVLPVIKKIMDEIGIKPLIVPIEPLELETESFWFYYLQKIKTLIPNQKI